MLEYEAKRQLELERAAYARKHRHSLRDLENGDRNLAAYGDWDNDTFCGMTIEEYPDMEQYLRPTCHRCRMSLKEIPKVFAKEQFGKLFFCEKETCPEYEKKVLIE